MQNYGVRWRRLVPGLALLALAACEVPTGLPKWDTVWIAPGKGTTIAVASLLPASVTTVPAGDVFLLHVAPVTAQQSLGEACPPCVLSNGLVRPKPEFTLSLTATAPLSAEVIAATLASGQVGVTLRHDFDFDPLRPSADAHGSLEIEIRSGSRTLTKYTIQDASWAPGTTLTRDVPIAGAVSDALDVVVTLYSPAGDPVRIDASQTLTVTVTPSQLRATQAQVKVANRSIAAQPVDLDLGDIDGVVTDHQKGGALLLDIDNPFAVTGTLAVTITAPGLTITRPVPLQTGSTTARVTLSESELGAILGQSPVRLSATGTVSAPSGGTAVRPSQAIGIASRLELTIGPKEEQ